MKSSVLILLFGLSTIFSCEAQKSNSKFKYYIDKFDQIDLPYTINQDRLDAQSKHDIGALDSLSVDFFIEKNKEMGGGVFLFKLYNYFPIGYFRIGEKYIATILEKNGGAGGIEKRFYLIIYNKSGDQVDKLLISKAIGDCSFLKIRTSEIDNKFKISIEDISYIGDCEKEIYTKKNNSKTNYLIENGRIIEL